MIWFGNLERIFDGGVPPGLPPTGEEERMRIALQRVAELAPMLCGDTLLDALAATGWVDRVTAKRLLPAFRNFDPDRHFGDYLRRLSFRGRGSEVEFVRGVRRVVEDLTGTGSIDGTGPSPWIWFNVDGREGIVLAQPEVGFTISGRTQESIRVAVEEMPDVLVVVARTFDRAAADQLSGILYRTDVPGTLVTVNHLLGIRATALRYQPTVDRVVDLFGRGGALRSADIATLGDGGLAQRFHIPGWSSRSTV